MKKPNVVIIEIEWRRSSLDEVKGQVGGGVCQIYGRHDIHGADTLLYIGKTCDFGVRFKQHKKWIEAGYDGIEIYFGTLRHDLSEEAVTEAEKLLIYFCSPPYNSQHIQTLDTKNPTLILNLGDKRKLPNEISTFYEISNYWTNH